MTENQLRVLWRELDSRDLIETTYSGMVPPWATAKEGVRMPHAVWSDFVLAVYRAEQAPEK